MGLTGLFAGVAGIDRNPFSAGFDAEHNRSNNDTRTVGEKLGMKTTRAVINEHKPVVSDLGRTGQNAVTDAAAVKQVCAAGKADLQHLRGAYKTELETAAREFNGGINEVAHNNGASAYQLGRSVGPQATSSGATIAADAVGGGVGSSISLVAEYIGDRTAMTKGKANELIAEVCDTLARQAHTARQQVELGIVPDGQQKPVMHWDKITQNDAVEIFSTPPDEHAEIKLIDEYIAQIEGVENQLEIAEATEDNRLTARKVEAALERGDVEFVQAALEIDHDLVLTEAQDMQFPEGDLTKLLGSYGMPMDLMLNRKILDAKVEQEEEPEQAVAQIPKQAQPLPVLIAPKPPTYHSDDPQEEWI